MTDKGSYTLLVGVDCPTAVGVGALGDVSFGDGLYAYTGSAFGAGGLSRVDRHASVASGDNDSRHWHVDYLLGSEASTLVGAFVTPDNAECEIARSIDGDPVAGFGASDCSCDSHLKRTKRSSVKDAYDGRTHELRTFE